MNETLNFEDFSCKSRQDVIQAHSATNGGQVNRLKGIPTKDLIKKYYPKSIEIDADDKLYNEKSTKFLMYMHRMWLEQAMCDMVIHAAGGNIMTHQSLVATYSPALSCLFSQNNIQKIASIKMCNVSVEVLADVLNFLYTTELKLNERIIEQVILCAKQLNIPLILEICKDYLIKYHNPENIIFHYSLAANYKLEPVNDDLMRLIAQNLEHYKDQTCIVFLPMERLYCLFKHPFVKSTPKSLFEILVKWISYDRCERLASSKRLFDLIDFEKISPEKISKVLDHNDWILKDDYCRNKVLKAYKYHAIVNSKPSPTENTERFASIKSLELFESCDLKTPQKIDMSNGNVQNDIPSSKLQGSPASSPKALVSSKSQLVHPSESRVIVPTRKNLSFRSQTNQTKDSTLNGFVENIMHVSTPKVSFIEKPSLDSHETREIQPLSFSSVAGTKQINSRLLKRFSSRSNKNDEFENESSFIMAPNTSLQSNIQQSSSVDGTFGKLYFSSSEKTTKSSVEQNEKMNKSRSEKNNSKESLKRSFTTKNADQKIKSLSFEDENNFSTDPLTSHTGLEAVTNSVFEKSEREMSRIINSLESEKKTHKDIKDASQTKVKFGSKLPSNHNEQEQTPKKATTSVQHSQVRLVARFEDENVESYHKTSDESFGLSLRQLQQISSSETAIALVKGEKR